MDESNYKNNAIESPFKRLIKECFTDYGPHYVNVLNIGDEALLARIHLIRSAKKTIYIQTYIWRNDEAGRLCVYELLEAAKRGVEVKILIDPWASEKNPQWTAFLATAHPNFEVKYYNPSTKEVKPSVIDVMRELTFNFRKVNNRMHNKLFIVDDSVGITGGRNYENDYYDRGTKRNFKDRDVMVVGSVVHEMTKSFLDYWSYEFSTFGRELFDVKNVIREGSFQKFKIKEDFCIGHEFSDLEKKASDQNCITERFINKAYKVSRVKFVADLPGKNKSARFNTGSIVSKEFNKLENNAKRSIIAQTPYLVLDNKTENSIKRLHQKRPNIEIIISTNSLASTDNIYTYSFACKERKMHVRSLHFRIFEFKPFPRDYEKFVGFSKEIDNANELLEEKPNLCVHSKTFVFDEDIVWIGSLNFDPRSFYLNTETALVIYDKLVAEAVKDDILRDISPENSWTVARRKKLPIISFISGLLGKVLRYIPFFGKWPFVYTCNFELKEGKEPLPFYHKDFYNHYSSVGPYPEVHYPLREIEVMLLKAFIGIAEPIL